MRFYRAESKPLLLQTLFREVPRALARCAHPGPAMGPNCGLWSRRGETWVAEYWGFPLPNGEWRGQLNKPMLGPVRSPGAFFFVALDTPRRFGAAMMPTDMPSSVPSGFLGFNLAKNYLKPPGHRVELYIALPGSQPDMRRYQGYAPEPRLDPREEPVADEPAGPPMYLPYEFPW